MRNRKVICGLNASPSQIKRNLRNLKTRGHMDIDEMLFVASKKINPIIEMLVETPNSTEHFLTIKECNDIEEVSNIIKDLAKALEHIGLQTNIEVTYLDMSQYKKNVNSEGYFYVDTTLLLQILELYNTLECISNDVDAFYRSLGIHCFVQTETSFISLRSSDSINPNKILFKFKKPPTKDVSSFSLFQQEFIVMPSSSQVPLNGSKSQILPNSGKEYDTRRIKSESSIENEATYEVTDVYGARKVMVRCIYDLQEVNDYLSIPRKDASTICSRAELDVSVPGTRSRNSLQEQERKATGSYGRKSQGNVVDKSSKQIIHDPENKEKCCCPECFASTQGALKECEDDQVIICIKGCNENDGDVQIVIRQCPDCKKAKGSPEGASGASPPSDHKSSTPPPALPVESKPKIYPTGSNIKNSIKSEILEARPSSASRGIDQDTAKKIESTILHNKDSKGSVICSDEEDEDKPKKQEPTYVQNQMSCSRIHLFETTNLCLQTETGQELVISLTVTPKDLSNLPKKISLTDIFSDSEYTPLNVIKSSADQKSDTSSKKSILSGSQGSGRKPGSIKQSVTYAVPERYIPLGRTKICSSLDFDVTTAESKIRDKGIKNKNNKIVVQLQEFGTDNLLRACRPAKCCRKAILNEKMKKCLPYAPSLQSLPLGDSDIQVINESLEMSLQKVKNSMNLKKDFYKNNQVYFMNPVHTVMYFLFDEDLSKRYKNNLVKQKLSYYINLVNDIELIPKAKYEIMYFDVESKLSKNQVNQSVKNCSIANGDKALEVDIAEVVSNPWKWIKQKYNNYEEKPMIFTGRQGFLMQSDSLATINNVKDKAGKQQVFKQRIPQKKPYVSRIPIYQRPKPLSFNSQKNLYDLSVGTLPQMQELDEQLLLVVPSEISLFEKANNEFTHKIHNISNRALDESSQCSKSKNPSKCSMTSTIKRSKRKKKEFYLSRSRSDISLNTLKHMSKNKNVTPLPKIATNQKPSKEISLKKLNEDVNQTNNSLGDQNSSRIILNYFTQILYELIMKQMIKDKQNNEVSENKNHLITIGVGTENTSILELYRKPLNHKRSLANHIKNLNKHSYHTLKAKQSQYCILPGSTKNICIFNNLALQTSKIISDNKKIQTSNTLLAYMLSQNRYMENHYCTYNSGESCEEIEKFIITFGSDHSFSSNFSERDFGCPNSCCCSSRVTESDQRETLSQSLIKLKETLEQYENVKNEIAQKSLEEANINPIEYFVYQVCACNSKLNKKPSIMQKILSKTKGLFSSVEKDMCRKYKNQREFLSMPKAEREKLCHKCGCIIDKCGEGTSLNQPVSPTLLLECECPEDNKSKQQKAKEPKQKPAFNFSKLASVSASSVKSIKTCIKNSLSDFMNRTKGQNLERCSCDKKEEVKEKKPIGTICISGNTSVIKCDKKNTSTGTTQDSSTQKCECGKCKSFADDGTCCCSHCLGCLDKSFDAKPDNNSIGIVTDTKSKPAVETKGDEESTKNISSMNSQSLKDNSSSNNNNQPNSVSQTSGLPNETETNATATVQDQAANVTPSVEYQTANNITPTVENQAANVTPSVEYQTANDIIPTAENEAAASNESDEAAQGNDIETIDTNDEQPNNDSAAYFFLTPPPHMFQNFRISSVNPFEQYLLSFPHMDMFHVGKSDGVVDE